eukprot:Rhum_TRINITY_DN12743_c1_g1::Rhum_TRINITY_DN12743_c1_g1_i1::g.53784::m.53784
MQKDTESIWRGRRVDASQSRHPACLQTDGGRVVLEAVRRAGDAAVRVDMRLAQPLLVLCEGEVAVFELVTELRVAQLAVTRTSAGAELEGANLRVDAARPLRTEREALLAPNHVQLALDVPTDRLHAGYKVRPLPHLLHPFHRRRQLLHNRLRVRLRPPLALLQPARLAPLHVEVVQRHAEQNPVLYTAVLRVLLPPLHRRLLRQVLLRRGAWGDDGDGGRTAATRATALNGKGLPRGLHLAQERLALPFVLRLRLPLQLPLPLARAVVVGTQLVEVAVAAHLPRADAVLHLCLLLRLAHHRALHVRVQLLQHRHHLPALALLLGTLPLLLLHHEEAAPLRLRVVGPLALAALRRKRAHRRRPRLARTPEHRLLRRRRPAARVAVAV